MAMSESSIQFHFLLMTTTIRKNIISVVIFRTMYGSVMINEKNHEKEQS